jgi:hypothetical protein
MSTLTGAEFNALFSNNVFYKLTNETEIHRGFTFVTGLNVDVVPFSPGGHSCHGGFYFTEENKIALWIDYAYQPMKYIRKVILPDDARVYTEKNRFKCDRFLLEDRILLQDFPLWSNHDFCKLAVQQNNHALRYVVNQTDELCRLAIQRDGYALQFVRNQTEELCRLAVQHSGRVLQYVVNQTDELCRLAVQQDEYALQFVSNQTEELCTIAVQRDGRVLQYIVNQTDELCRLAVQQDRYAFQYIRNPFQRMKYTP